ncbi:MAG: ABC transporter substrate-binding protein [Sphingomonadaceae bacterium]
MQLKTKLLTGIAFAVLPAMAQATDLEVTHWWTSGGESAAVAQFAKAYDALGDGKWIDTAIAGQSNMISTVSNRILGGDPPAATQFTRGRDTEELIKAGLMLDITDVAEAEGWADVVRPKSLMDSCSYEGKVYCVPVNIHSWQWMWVSNKAFADAGLPIPKDIYELIADAPKLREAGKAPLVMGLEGWQVGGAWHVVAVDVAGPEIWTKLHTENDPELVKGPEMRKAFELFDQMRQIATDSNIIQWNDGINKLIRGEGAAQILGDYAKGEFVAANQKPGEDFDCILGLGIRDIMTVGGDAFYFPKNDDPKIEASQKRLAALMMSPEAQVAFNSFKGSTPVRGDVDLNSVDECMAKGLKVLDEGKTVLDRSDLLSPDTRNQLRDVLMEFWTDHSITVDDLIKRYAAVTAAAY